MSRIHIARDRQPLGQFGPEEVAEGLRSGRFLPTDLAWREGMEAWEPLSTFHDLPAVAEPSLPQAPAPFLAPGIEVLEPERASVPTPPWEEEKPFLSRLLETIQKVLLSPSEAFANVPAGNGILRSMGFMLLVGWPAMVISLAYQFVAEMVTAGAEPVADQPGPAIMGAVYAGLAVFAPFIFVIGSFVSSAIFHGVLMMLGAANKPYWTTFRIVTYVNGATMVFLFVPLCGSLVQSCWAVYALAVGLKTAHRTTWTNTIVTLLLPMVICCGLVIGIASLGYAELLRR